MREAAASARAFASELARMEREIGGLGPLWLRRLQTRAFERFLSLGFPAPRDEEWRQTSVAPIASTPYARVQGAVSLDGETIVTHQVSVCEGSLIRVGKHRFLRIVAAPK